MECETDQWLNMKMYNSKMRLESHLEDPVVACFERDFMAAEGYTLSDEGLEVPDKRIIESIFLKHI